jgi:hypothetical protein
MTGEKNVKDSKNLYLFREGGRIWFELLHTRYPFSSPHLGWQSRRMVISGMVFGHEAFFTQSKVYNSMLKI